MQTMNTHDRGPKGNRKTLSRSAIRKVVGTAFLLGVVVGQCMGAQVATSSASVSNKVTLLEAAQSALIHHPLLRSQEAQVQISWGLREQASGAFDTVSLGGFNQQRVDTPWTAAEQQQYGIQLSDQRANLTSLGVGYQRLFRNGISINEGFQLNRTTDNLFSVAGVNSSSMNLLVTIPLLRGRGRKVAAAGEQAAIAEMA
jgi:hypothetical protein